MATMTLIIGNKNYSSWSLRPWLVMKHFRIPFKEHEVALYQPGYKEKLLQFSPAGQVPILRHGRNSIWESIAIMEYLAESFPKKNLWPSDPQKRALGRSLCAEMHAGFTALRRACPMDVTAVHKPMKNTGPEVEGDIRRIKEIWDDSRRRHAREGLFLLGEFSITDGMFAPIIWRFQSYGISTEGRCAQYVETMLSHPAMREWKEAAQRENYPALH